MATDWIDEPSDLQTFCAHISQGPVAVDTESDHFHAYQARVCLIQLATEDQTALVDPLALDAEELSPLFELFENPTIPKVLHSARNDLNELDRDYGIGITNLFDTQIAARFLGCERNSLDWMLEHILDAAPGKSFARYDWTTRPLSEDARHYAAEDVRHLLSLRNRFVDRLEGDGWMMAFRQQCNYVAANTEYQSSDFDPFGWRDLDGISRLEPDARAALHELYSWRHRLCARLNQSAVTVFPDGALVELARRRPTTRTELDALDGLPAPLVDDHADELLETLRQARDTSPPRAEPDRRDHVSTPPDQKQCFQALRKWRNKTARHFDIPTEFIATNATLSTLAEDPPETRDELASCPDLLDWHLDLLGDEILDIIAETRHQQRG